MATTEIVPALAGFIPHENAALQSATLQLLRNLSFNSGELGRVT